MAADALKILISIHVPSKHGSWHGALKSIRDGHTREICGGPASEETKRAKNPRLQGVVGGKGVGAAE